MLYYYAHTFSQGLPDPSRHPSSPKGRFAAACGPALIIEMLEFFGGIPYRLGVGRGRRLDLVFSRPGTWGRAPPVESIWARYGPICAFWKMAKVFQGDMCKHLSKKAVVDLLEEVRGRKAARSCQKRSPAAPGCRLIDEDQGARFVVHLLLEPPEVRGVQRWVEHHVHRGAGDTGAEALGR